MNKDAEMAEYRLMQTFRGQPCELYFFQTFSGYSHPVKPVTPLRWRDALSRKGFCKAYLCPTKFGTAFVFFKGQSFKRIPIDLPILSNETIERYFAVVHEGTSIVAGKEITSMEAIDLDEYLCVIPSLKDSTSNRVELVKIDSWYTYDYTYDERGNLIRTVVDNGFRKSILEPGKEPQIIHNKRQP